MTARISMSLERRAVIDRAYNDCRDLRSGKLPASFRSHPACGRTARPQSRTSIKLIAVTKTVPPDNIREAVDAGIRDIGENRLQEALPNGRRFVDLPLDLALHRPSCKRTKPGKPSENFDWIQCVDRPELARKLNQVACETVYLF